MKTSGVIRPGICTDAGQLLWLPGNHNQIQYGWGYIAAQAIGKGLRNFRIAGMYLEYENVADPEDDVTAPAFSADEGLAYYDDLQLTSDRDYLRCSLLQEPLLSVAAGFEDYFSDGTGNKLTFMAMSSGVVGVHGKPFSSGANSKVFGAALVAMPVSGDRSQDIIFSRAYLTAGSQPVKTSSGHIVMAWDINFGSIS